MTASVYLAPATRSGGVYPYLERAVRTGVERDFYEQFTESDYGDPARVWGLTSSIEPEWDSIDAGDWLLFYTRENSYEYAARVTGTEHNEPLGNALRTDVLDADKSEDRNWDLLVFLDDPVPVSISGDDVQDRFDYGNRFPVRFIRVTDERLDSVHSEYGDVERFIDAIADDS
jgi:hypothetical protein